MKMIRAISGSAAICLVFFAAARAQDAEASRVFQAAMTALGGEGRIKSLGSIYVSARGFEDGTSAAQANHPEKQAPNPHEEKLAVFFDGRRLAYEYKTARGDGTTRWRRFFYPDSRRIVADLGTRSVYSSNVQFPSADRDQDARRVPHAFLLELLANSQRLTYLGTRDYDGRLHEVISAMLPAGKTPVSLYFDRQTHLLTKYEYSTDFPGLGASLIEYVFTGYHPHPELGWFPAGHSILVNGKTWRSVKFDRVLANSKEAEGMLSLPADLEGFITPAGTVRQIARGVYFVYGVGGSFQPMFIEFRDFVMAIEAPAHHPSLEDTPVETIGNINAVSDEFIAKIRQTVPNKPIRYVVLTHCHSDHMGGLRAFVGEHPTILTTPGNTAFYERFVPGLKIEAFDKKRVITDGERTVELINVGANPHTDENIVVYLPAEKYLFQGDLFYFSSEATFPAVDRMTVMPFFAKWLKTNNIAPDRIYGFHSTMFGTMGHIEKILKLDTNSGK